MKEYADKRRNARESLIFIRDTVLLRQNRGETLTPAYDPSPYSVRVFPYPETHILSNMCSPTQKHISLAICAPLP